MRSLTRARAEARAARVKVDAVTLDDGAIGALEPGMILLAKLVKYLEETLEVTLVPLSNDLMQGDSASLNTDGFLKYFQGLNATERLEKFAHELGHKLMHRRLSDPTVPVDPLYTSIYGEAGAIALTRYSKRMREEAEANAFAQEFLCPSDVVFAAWQEDEAATTESLAAEQGVTEQIVRVQLANALHELSVGRKEAPSKRAVTYSEEQDRAARHTGTPVLVDAGPGTGKTATLIRRLEYLMEHGADPSQMLVLTFSNEAALELQERIAARFGDKVADAMTISTFHGFGMELLHVHGGSAGGPKGYEPGFGLMDDDGQAELITELIGRVPCPNLKPMSDPADTALAVVEHINHCKHRLRSVDSLDEAIRQWHVPPTQAVPDVKGASREVKAEAKRIKKENEERDKEEERRNASVDLLALYREYERVKLERQRVDFADLILLPLQLLEKHEEIRAIYRKKYPWVLVDEFQDVSRATSRLLRAICGKENPPWVVGDARQAIYQFLGADADNVRAMERDFPDVTRYPLKDNYRSAEPIVEAANDLAELLGSNDVSWRAASDARPLGEHPVAIAEAASDLGEARGVVEQVKNWIGRDGVKPGDIAILARRHVDVRNIVMALTEERIIAQAAGMMTAEGAAGDMAVVLTLADRPAPSLPRLAHALGTAERVETINATVEFLVKRERKTKAEMPDVGDESETAAEGDEADDPKVSRDLVNEIDMALEAAQGELHSGDGFVALTTFLFNSSDYLRRLLAAEATAERQMSLVEIVSTLTLAATYRSTHKGVKPMRARRGFAERLRSRLTRYVPIPIIPRPRSDTVRVMTCHAAKGLEFPCVAVASQTYTKFPGAYRWLPDAFREDVAEDEDQPDSLLFVGVTRAQRAVVVSFPTKAGEGPNAKDKRLVRLLERWRTASRDGETGVRVHEMVWGLTGGKAAQSVVAGPLWGDVKPVWLKPSVLDEDRCPLETYLEKFLGLSFPEGERELYPLVFGVLRRVLRQMADVAMEAGAPMAEADARALLEKELPKDRWGDHPHYEWYYGIALRAVQGFRDAFRPKRGELTRLDPEMELDPSGSGDPPVKLDLIALYKDASGRTAGIMFRPESYAKIAEDGEINWGKLDGKRASLVLLLGEDANARMQVYSGIDGRIYEYLPSIQAASLPKELDRVRARHAALANADFGTDADRWSCDQCRMRVNCPHWIGALQRTEA